MEALDHGMRRCRACPASLLFLLSSLSFSAVPGFSSPAARAALENVSVMYRSRSGDEGLRCAGLCSRRLNQAGC